MLVKISFCVRLGVSESECKFSPRVVAVRTDETFSLKLIESESVLSDPNIFLFEQLKSKPLLIQYRLYGPLSHHTGF